MTGRQKTPGGESALRRVKRQLGPVQVLKLSARSLPQLHGALGRAVRRPVQALARRELRKMTADERGEALRFVRGCRAITEARQQIIQSADVRWALASYLKCLEYWARGAKLQALLISPLLPRTLDGKPVTALDLAWWLQNDNLGCQSGLVRTAGDRILFWHTEEDRRGAVDRPRLLSATVGGKRYWSFLYPQLLPGGAFSWTGHRFQAVDSLYVRLGKNAPGVLANAAAWIALWFGERLPLSAVARALRPMADGYAINWVIRGERAVRGERVEFGGRSLLRSPLPGRTGSALIQANCVSDRHSTLWRKFNYATARKDRLLRNRLKRSWQYLGRCFRQSGTLTIPALQTLLASRQGGAYGYANADVKAYCFGEATPVGISVYVGSGPALVSDQPPRFGW
ncbi:MAG: hypothetical protein HYV42_05270 [Candidatus Magasanikbacteria bacterium]|nr:hypothetical protein [Candidatus Magasanikbacteria bacterium]